MRNQLRDFSLLCVGSIAVWAVMFASLSATAQSSFELGGIARGVADLGFLGIEDTVSRDIGVESHAIYDLALRGSLNSKAEVYVELRLGTNLALFDTSASYAQVRRVVLSGKLNDRWGYEIGDIDVAWSPFTIWNSESEGAVHESNLFAQWRNLQNYENFSQSNAWRLRGAQAKGIWTQTGGGVIQSSGFLSRIEASDEIVRPDVILAGMATTWAGQRLHMALRAQDFMSLGRTIPGGQSSHVVGLSGETKWTQGRWSFQGEIGGSLATTLDEDGVAMTNVPWTKGGFWQVSSETTMLKAWKVRVASRSVSDTYMSPAAQTKRISFGEMPSVFPVMANGVWSRPLSQGDLLTAPYLPQGVRPWNRILRRGLMAFDPRYGTATPYGVATPNRRGLELELERGSQEQPWALKLGGAFLQDLTPEGSVNRRNYICGHVSGHMDLSKCWEGTRAVVLSGGWRSQHAQRPEALLNPVDLTSMVLDAGLDWSITSSVQVGYGMKRVSAEGLDYTAVRDANYIVTGFDMASLNLRDQMHAWGMTWSLGEHTEASFQWQRWSLIDNLQGHAGTLSHALFLFQTKF